MPLFNKVNSFANLLTTKTLNLNTDTVKVMLTNTAPVATNVNFADLTEITAGNGYTAGGAALTLVTNSQSGGTERYIPTCANPLWTATGGSIGPWRYLVMYDLTATSSPIIGWWDFGTSVTTTVGNTITPIFDQTNGAVQIA